MRKAKSFSSHGGQEGNEVRALLLLLDTREDHLGARDVLLWVHQILEHVLVGPNNAGVLVRLGVSKPVIGAGLAAHDAPKRGPLLSVPALLDGVALGTLRFEELRALCLVTLGDIDLRLCDNHGCRGVLTPSRLAMLVPR